MFDTEAVEESDGMVRYALCDFGILSLGFLQRSLRGSKH